GVTQKIPEGLCRRPLTGSPERTRLPFLRLRVRAERVEIRSVETSGPATNSQTSPSSVWVHVAAATPTHRVLAPVRWGAFRSAPCVLATHAWTVGEPPPIVPNQSSARE